MTELIRLEIHSLLGSRRLKLISVWSGSNTFTQGPWSFVNPLLSYSRQLRDFWLVPNNHLIMKIQMFLRGQCHILDNPSVNLENNQTLSSLQLISLTCEAASTQSFSTQTSSNIYCFTLGQHNAIITTARINTAHSRNRKPPISCDLFVVNCNLSVHKLQKKPENQLIIIWFT